jgi:ribosomal protein S18 acetylase RimI-like enzyme
MSPTPTPHEPIILKAAQAEAGAHVLAKAFQDDPLMVYMLPSAQKRRRLLPDLFGFVVRYCLRYGVIYTTPGLEGLVCSLPPGQAKTAIRLALISLSGAPIQLGPTGLWRYLRASKYTGKAHEQAAPGLHWYIWALGVDPACQGRGFGGQLVRAVLQQARVQGLPCYLDTQNPDNVPFYQRQGLRQESEAMVPDSGVRVYAMLWKPDNA